MQELQVLVSRKQYLESMGSDNQGAIADFDFDNQGATVKTGIIQQNQLQVMDSAAFDFLQRVWGFSTFSCILVDTLGFFFPIFYGYFFLTFFSTVKTIFFLHFLAFCWILWHFGGYLFQANISSNALFCLSRI